MHKGKFFLDFLWFLPADQLSTITADSSIYPLQVPKLSWPDSPLSHPRSSSLTWNMVGYLNLIPYALFLYLCSLCPHSHLFIFPVYISDTYNGMLLIPMHKHVPRQAPFISTSF
jgi:hypothetical protein